MDTTKIVIAIVIIVLLGGGAYWYFQKQNGEVMDSSTVPTTSVSTEPTVSSSPEVMASDGAMKAASDSSTTTEGGVKEFTITGSSFKFEPNVLSVNKGDKVKITFKNSGGFHDLTIDGYGVKTKQIAAGATDSLEFTADKAGTFEFYCSVGNHRAMGMKGTLTVK